MVMGHWISGPASELVAVPQGWFNMTMNLDGPKLDALVGSRVRRRA